MKRSLVLTACVLIGTPALTWAQGEWNDDASAVTADLRARDIGDILTVIIQENKTATKNTSTAASKSSGVDAGIETLFFSPGASGLLTKNGQLPALKFNTANSFSGNGNISSSERITSRLSVRIVDILPNRHFVVEGTQRTSFGGESQDVLLRGVIREHDITALNSVMSYNVADVTIRFLSKGVITDKQKRGWFNKAWDKVTPF